MKQEYHIKLDIFEGPLDLLLYLVEKDEVDIQNIQVGRVCVQFLEYLNLIQELDIELAGEYLVMASTLTRLKARELLPHDDSELLAQEGEIISREQLIAQLLEYKKFKEAAVSLKKKEDNQIGAFYKTQAEKIEWHETFEESGIEVGVFDLLTAFRSILQRLDNQPQHQIIREEINLDDRIEYVLTFLYDIKKARFDDLFAGVRTRMMIVVTFMSVLELMKMSQILVRQEQQFGEIWVYLREKENVNIIEEQENKNETVQTEEAANRAE
jgi:segregation and condensation protein A